MHGEKIKEIKIHYPAFYNAHKGLLF